MAKKKLWSWNGKEYTKDELCKIAGISKSRFNQLMRGDLNIDEIMNHKSVLQLSWYDRNEIISDLC